MIAFLGNKRSDVFLACRLDSSNKASATQLKHAQCENKRLQDDRDKLQQQIERLKGEGKKCVGALNEYKLQSQKLQVRNRFIASLLLSCRIQTCKRPVVMDDHIGCRQAGYTNTSFIHTNLVRQQLQSSKVDESCLYAFSNPGILTRAYHVFLPSLVDLASLKRSLMPAYTLQPLHSLYVFVIPVLFVSSIDS